MQKILAAFAVFIILLLTPAPEAFTPEGWQMVAVMALMLILWISEAIPLAATALMPIVLLPLMGILPMRPTAAAYAHPVVFLLFGGFVLALAMEKAGLPRRIVLLILRQTGTRIPNILLGFMIASALLSMWISNTATTAAMLPIALSLLALLTNSESGFPEEAKKRFALALLIGIAFAADMGGTATLIGTAPNALFAAFLEQQTGIEISFAQWMAVGVPFMIVMVFLLWALLNFVVFRNTETHLPSAQDQLREAYEALGPMSREEKTIAGLFLTAVFFWMFRRVLPLPDAGNTGIAIAAASLCFIVPTRWKPFRALLEWEDTAKIPWGVLILFGGGLSMAAGVSETGLANLVGDILANEIEMTILLLIGVVAVAIFMTEVMSNTALTATMLPVIFGISMSAQLHPIFLGMSMTLAASCAFMLPTATPPNAIIFGSEHVHMKDLIRAGFFANLISIAVLALAATFLIPAIFGFSI